MCEGWPCGCVTFVRYGMNRDEWDMRREAHAHTVKQVGNVSRCVGAGSDRVNVTVTQISSEASAESEMKKVEGEIVQWFMCD
jgi:hypothetical protein